jgi:C4-dicarboxylate transporter/malic acid transport protein
MEYEMTKSKLSFQTITQHFAPGWFAAVMGTAVTVVALFVFRQFVPFAGILQLFFLAISALLFLVLLVPWGMRWFLYPDAVRHDLSHPVSAAFFPTMPISLLVFGIALEKTPLAFLPENVVWYVLLGLWVAGAIGILLFALTILNTFFHQPGVKWETSTLGWLIPPVSALLVPVLGSSLAVHFASTPWGAGILYTSLLFLGMGGLLFLLVMSMAFTRYIFYALPPVHLSPTLWVGIAPTSILTIVSLKLVAPLKSIFGLNAATGDVLDVLAKISGVTLWGFSLFWLALAILVTLEVHRKTPLPFALSWWAFVFPIGAFTVASGVLYQSAPFDFFLWVGLAALASLLVVWLVTILNTVRGAWNGSLFQPHTPPAKPQPAMSLNKEV